MLANFRHLDEEDVDNLSDHGGDDGAAAPVPTINVMPPAVTEDEINAAASGAVVASTPAKRRSVAHRRSNIVASTPIGSIGASAGKRKLLL